MVVNYSPPNLIAESDEELKLVLNSINSKYPSEAMILLGDFNRTLEEVKELGTPFGLHTLRPSSDKDWYTHQQVRLDSKQTSELDYILSNMPMTNLSKEEDNKPVKSDHVVLQANIAVDWLR